MLSSNASHICTQIIEFEYRKIYNICTFLVSCPEQDEEEKSSAIDLPTNTDERDRFLSSLSLDFIA